MEIKAESNIKQKILESNAEYHDYWADTHDSNVPYICRPATRKYYWELIESSITEAGNKITNADVLEIGCGTGTFTDIFIAKGASSFTGIDLSSKMIDTAKAKAAANEYKVSVNFFVDSLEKFALNNQAKFDIIESSSFIHHLSDIEEGVNCIKSMLKPGGVYVAIHEEVNGWAKTKIEKIDDQLQYLYGYAGAKLINKKQRIKETVKQFFVEPVRFRLRRLFASSEKKLEQPTEPIQNTHKEVVNYVDFQLNESFSLSEKCSKYGKIKQYCYLGFSELMIFGKPLNHEMLIMKK